MKKKQNTHWSFVQDLHCDKIRGWWWWWRWRHTDKHKWIYAQWNGSSETKPYCYTELNSSSPAVAVTIGSMVLAVPTHRGMARLSFT